ncbi:MAG: aspartate 1-decarboxylase [Phycisphaerales bacterium]|nr:aspartate 1-decarboxylase [Phycisphaerales bacterium]
MLLKLLRGKIHRATVTEAMIDYVGSITIDKDLLDASGIMVGECVLVADMTDGARFETYVFEGEPGSGVICINGAAARLVNVGDEVIIMAYGYMESEEARALKPNVVLVDKANRVSDKL